MAPAAIRCDESQIVRLQRVTSPAEPADGARRRSKMECMNTGRRDLRVSDRERQAAADRLKHAHDEGRLDFAEYDRRLGLAYGSTTYGDLDQLFADLPIDAPAPLAVRPNAAAAVGAGTAPVAATGRSPDALSVAFGRLPLALKILWTIWATAMAINLTVWTLVGFDDGDLPYFWPVWLLIPGLVLGGATAAVTAARAGRSPRRGPGEG